MTPPVTRALDELKAGRMVIVTDDGDRENEGDLVMAASLVTPADVNQMAAEARGLICCAVTAGIAERLGLHETAARSSPALHGTAFTESVDWITGSSTGISAADRARTLRGLAGNSTCPEDLARPGHVFPIVARPGGVLERPGHTEAAVDLCRLAGLPPAGVICEVMNPDGTMARGKDLAELARRRGFVMISVADIIHYRKDTETLLTPAAKAQLPTRWGNFTLHSMDSSTRDTREGPLLLSRGAAFEKLPAAEQMDSALLVRIHSECFTGDLLGSLRCDCGEQLAESMRIIGLQKEGAIIYLRQEGRGIGLKAKLQAYTLQEEGLDTVEANERLGYPADARDYWEAAQILRLMGVRRVRLLTNNPRKIAGLREYGIRVVEHISLHVAGNPHNLRYLETKRSRLGHVI